MSVSKLTKFQWDGLRTIARNEAREVPARTLRSLVLRGYVRPVHRGLYMYYTPTEKGELAYRKHFTVDSVNW
jgi:hypothetical protein